LFFTSISAQHQPIIPGPHTCTFCGRTFQSSSNKKKHMLIHTGEKPYQCTICGRKFSQSSNMRVHLVTHYKPWSWNVSCTRNMLAVLKYLTTYMFWLRFSVKLTEYYFHISIVFSSKGIMSKWQYYASSIPVISLLISASYCFILIKVWPS